jgi:hypothetical protein
MKIKGILLITLCLLMGCKVFDKKVIHNDSAKIDSMFSYHFGVLDSIACNDFIDSKLKCVESINFMELNTGISSSTDGNYFGKTSFTKEDLKSWHVWYELNKDSLIWDEGDGIVKIKK